MTNPKALEEILQIGRIERDIQKAREADSKREKIDQNVYASIANLEGMPTTTDDKGQIYVLGVPIDKFSQLDPIMVPGILRDAHEVAQPRFVETVGARMSDAISSLGEREDAVKRIASLLVNIAPVEFQGQDNFRTAHREAYEAKQGGADPHKNFETKVQPYNNKLIGRALRQLFYSNGEVQKYFMMGVSAEEAEERLKKVLERQDSAREYLGKVYSNAEDKAKKLIAYVVGRKLLEINESKNGNGKK